jgi:hypothetical protein
MKQTVLGMLATLALLTTATVVSGHDDRLHGPNAMTGEIVNASADGLHLKTKAATVTVKYSSKTKFEHDKKDVTKSHVKTGDRAGVIGSKQPNGDVIANLVILGLPAPKAASEAKK